MSKPKSRSELPLFDLPLQSDDEETTSPGPSSLFDEPQGPESLEKKPKDDGVSELPLAADTGEEGSEDGKAEEDPDRIATDQVNAGGVAPLRDRLLSGLLDLGVQLLILGGCMAAVHAMGIELELTDWVPFAVLALIFSFLYWFIPLAFWGQTPGMAWVGNSALSLSDEPLTFGQSVLRWLGALMTLGLLGFPLLLTLGGRSLTDRLSDSKTVLLDQ